VLIRFLIRSRADLPDLMVIVPAASLGIHVIGDYRVARVAFDEAVKRRPGRIVILRQTTRAQTAETFSQLHECDFPAL